MNDQPVVQAAAPKQRAFLRILIAVGLVAVASLANGFSQAYAAATAPCDPQFMDAIEARGYIEAQRQIEQNGNLILKQDSVLEYTCFDRLMGNLSDDGIWRLNAPFTDQNSGTPFSNPNGFAPPEYKQTNNTLWGSLAAVVWSSLNEYMLGTYGDNTVRKLHGYLSGRAGTPSWSIPAAPPQAVYTCSDMETVWVSAHCMHFMDEPKHDGFYDFYWYAEVDARKNNFMKPWLQVPPNIWNHCPGTVPSINAGKRLNDTSDIEVAFNKMGVNFSLNPENPWSNANVPVASAAPGGVQWGTGSVPVTDTNPYIADPVVSHLDLILPIGTAPAPGNCTTVKPEPTGICMIREGLTGVYQDAVCPNPGCYYKLPAAVTPGNGADITTCPGPLGTCAP